MKKSEIRLNDMQLVGITIKTNPKTAKIGHTIGAYFENNWGQKIPERTKPGTTYCVYTDYESDEHGEYTYFIGEEVHSFKHIDPMFVTLTIPACFYAQFECGPGKMPMVCIDAWKKIWHMSESDLGGKRAYIADFEIYDKRAQDPSNTTLDIYIGIHQSL